MLQPCVWTLDPVRPELPDDVGYAGSGGAGNVGRVCQASLRPNAAFESMDITTFSKIHSGSPILTTSFRLRHQTRFGYKYLLDTRFLSKGLPIPHYISTQRAISTRQIGRRHPSW